MRTFEIWYFSLCWNLRVVIIEFWYLEGIGLKIDPSPIPTKSMGYYLLTPSLTFGRVNGEDVLVVWNVMFMTVAIWSKPILHFPLNICVCVCVCVCVLSVGSLLPFTFFPFSLLSCLLDLKALLHKKKLIRSTRFWSGHQ
jgi:hypothetical protein